MQRSLLIILIPAVLFLAIGLWALRPSTPDTGDGNDTSASRFEPGDIVTVGPDGAELKRDDRVLAQLSAGTELSVMQVKGDWIGVSVTEGDDDVRGWLKQQQLQVVNEVASETRKTAPAETKTDPVLAQTTKPTENEPREQPTLDVGTAPPQPGSLADKFAKLMADEKAMESHLSGENVSPDKDPPESVEESPATAKAAETAGETQAELAAETAGEGEANTAAMNETETVTDVATNADIGSRDETPTAAPDEVPADQTQPPVGAFSPPTEQTQEETSTARLMEGFPVKIARTSTDLLDLDSDQLLGQLTITGDHFTGHSLRYLDGMQILSLSIEAVHVENSGLHHIAKVRNLRGLRLWTPGVNDQGLSALKELDQLQLLDLEGTAATGSGLSHLNELKTLNTLTLGPQTTDRSLQTVAKLGQLQELDLRACRRLSLEGLRPLPELRQLKVVWLPSQMDSSARKWLRQALPNCRVR